MTSNDSSAHLDPVGNATFSADVVLRLHVGNQSFEVASLGPDFGYLREAHVIDVPEAEIETIIDAKVSRWPIQLTKLPTDDSKRFEFVAE